MKLSSKPQLVTVFGGSGFVGRYVVRALVNRGYQVRVACRRPDLAGHLQPLGNVGQIHLMQANLRYPDSVAAAVKGASVVVNLVGILAESGKQKFDAVQFYGAQSVAKAAKDAGARLVHMSAIGADAESESAYGETKGKAEEAVRKIVRSSVIIRPSIVFGQEDDFFNRFGAMTRLAPALPLIGGGITKFQPVYVGDVAEAVAKAVDGGLKDGKTYELGGPEVKTFRECLELLLSEVGRSKMFVNLPFFAASAIGKLIGWLPGAPITYDQVVMLRTDNVVSEESIKADLTLEGMGIKPTPLAGILPSYLVQYRPQGQFTDISREET